MNSNYKGLIASASNTGAIMVDSHFSDFLEKILPGFIETLLNSILEEGTLETLKIEPFLKKFSRTLYRTLETLEGAKFKFEFLKNKENNFISIFNQSSSLHEKYSKKSRPSDKNYKKSKAVFNRFNRSCENFLKNFGICEKSFSIFVKNSPIFPVSEIPVSFRHFLWYNSFLDGAQKQIIHVFDKVFDHLLGDYGEKIAIFLNIEREVLEIEIKNQIIVMVLKDKNKLYLYNLRQTGSEIIKRVKALQKLHLKGEAFIDLFIGSDVFLKKEQSQNFAVEL